MPFPTAIPTLQSGDITLSALTSADTEALFHLVVKNRMHLRKWLNWVDETTAIDHTMKYVQRSLERHQEHTGLHYTIWRGNKMIGVIAYDQVDHHDKKGTIGYWIDEEYQNHGYMTEACKLLIDFGIKTLELHRIEIYVAEGNGASSAIPIRLGFQKEAVLKDAQWLNDHYANLELYRFIAEK